MHLDTATPPSKVSLLSSSFSGTPAGVREALAAATSQLRAFGASDEEAFTAELVIAEALNNVVEHALAGMNEPSFELVLETGKDGVSVRISDKGLPMPNEQLPAGVLPEITDKTEDLPEGGFGWFMIRDLAHDLKYERTSEQNQLNFRLAICL